MIKGTNCYRIYHILQIWHTAIFPIIKYGKIFGSNFEVSLYFLERIQKIDIRWINFIEMMGVMLIDEINFTRLNFFLFKGRQSDLVRFDNKLKKYEKYLFFFIHMLLNV